LCVCVCSCTCLCACVCLCTSDYHGCDAHTHTRAATLQHTLHTQTQKHTHDHGAWTHKLLGGSDVAIRLSGGCGSQRKAVGSRCGRCVSVCMAFTASVRVVLLCPCTCRVCVVACVSGVGNPDPRHGLSWGVCACAGLSSRVAPRQAGADAEAFPALSGAAGAREDSAWDPVSRVVSVALGVGGAGRWRWCFGRGVSVTVIFVWRARVRRRCCVVSSAGHVRKKHFTVGDDAGKSGS
jgi:hypothetical protein